MRNRSVPTPRLLTRAVALAMAALSAASAAPSAERKTRWFAGASISYRSNMDEIRSNASVAIGPLGADGLPFTFDVGETDSCLDPNVFCDPRPDYMLNTPALIQDAYQYDLHGGYLVKDWLSVQIDASYFQADAGPIDGYMIDHYPALTNPNDGLSFLAFRDRQEKFPIRVGRVAETPVFLTAVIHFKTKSDVKPYFGVGYGRIFATLNADSDIADMNEFLGSLRIRAMTNQFGEDISPKNYSDPLNDAHIPIGDAVTVDLQDPSAWLITGGAEWKLTRRIGVVFDARYQFVPGGVSMDISGHDQVDLLIWAPEIYRPDGTVRIFNQHDKAPNPLCFDNLYQGLGCDPVHMAPADARVNPGAIRPNSDPNKPPVPYYTCPAFGDFDKNGSIDVCYGDNILPSPSGSTEPRGDVVIQGGQLSLSAFIVSLGLRIHF